MAAPRELSLEAICNFISENGGKVTNHDLVKHFKPFLTDPESRVEARNKFKEYVNQCAVLKNEEGEKYLVLKKKFRNGGFSSMDNVSISPTSPGSYSSDPSLPSTPSHDPYSPVGYPGMEQRISPMRQPPPYRSPPPVMQSPSSSGMPSPDMTSPSLPNLYQIPTEIPSVSPNSIVKKLEYETDYNAPPVPPRRKSSDKLKVENKENVPDTMKRPRTLGAENGNTDGGNTEVDADRKISVKEQMQKFNRLATESELAAASRVFPGGLKKRAERTQQGADDDDTASVTSLDAKSREWLVCSSQADYQALAKLVKENTKLAKLRDPTNGYTALHWAAKHGEENVVKLIAGVYRADVNARTNGGYTPLHIAMMYGNENIFNLLVTVYGADPNIRDWSGRKPRQYLTSQDTSVSADTFRKIKARKKHAEKDLGFLRIGSLNVRVKRTTEAVSNFLGVGNSQNQKIHKSWGSADNIKEVNSRQLMPPPQFPVKKRKSKRAQDFTSRSTPTTPPVKNRTSASSAGDSDSDTACGFDSNWQGTV